MAIIGIKNQQKKIPLSPLKIKKVVRRVLRTEGVKKADLSVVFVTDRIIRQLNKKFLNRDRTTDVLAFDLRDLHSPKGRSNRKIIEGEIVISATTAHRNARLFKTSLFEELVLYVVHGILHLLGYDDHSSHDKKRMRLKESNVMEYLGYNRKEK